MKLVKLVKSTLVVSLGLITLSGCSKMLNYESMDANLALGAVKDLSDSAMLSDEEVKKMALGYAKEADSKHRIAPSNSSYAKRLQKLSRKHLKEDGLNLNYKVYLSKQVNAFAMADGTIRFYSGLMDLMNDDELLFILGHEIGHVKHGHIANKVRLANATSGVRKGVASSHSVAGDLAASGVVGGTLEKLINSQFSQTQENEADEYGVEFMKRSGYNVDGAITSFNKLAELSSKKGFVDQLFASHPTSEKRAQNLAKIIGKDSSIQIASVDKLKSENQESSSGNENEQSETDYSALAGSAQDLASKSNKIDNKIDDSNVAAALSSGVDTSVSGYDSQPIDKSSSGSTDAGFGPGWYVQVIASVDKNAAKRIEQKYRESGFNSGGQEAFVKGATYQRVLIGPFAAKSEARQQVLEIKDAKITTEDPFLKYINESSVSKSVDNTLAQR